MSNTPTPAVPAKDVLSPVTKNSSLERIYKLYYRRGTELTEKHFEFPGNLKEATERARQHCDVMGIRFIWVRPFIVHLDHQEEMKRLGQEIA